MMIDHDEQSQGVVTGDQIGMPSHKLLVGGLVPIRQHDRPVELCRGMPVQSRNGYEVGTVAGVLSDCQSQSVTHVVLGSAPPVAAYRLVPIQLIVACDDQVVVLDMDLANVEILPFYQPD